MGNESSVAERTRRIKGGLRAERGRSGLSQAEVAEFVGVSGKAVSMWESDDQSANISFEKAWRLADLYDVSLDQLAGRLARL